MIEIISLILNAVLGSSFILFYSSEKKRRRAEAKGSERSSDSIAIQNAVESAVEWKEIAESREVKLVKKDEQLDRLWAEKIDDRHTIHTLETEVNIIKIELANANFTKCEKRRCESRTPPNEFF